MCDLPTDESLSNGRLSEQVIGRQGGAHLVTIPLGCLRWLAWLVGIGKVSKDNWKDSRRNQEPDERKCVQEKESPSIAMVQRTVLSACPLTQALTIAQAVEPRWL